MRLILVRHAKAEDRELGKEDLERALTPRGIKQAQKVGKILAKKYPKIDAIITSLAFRARDTAKYIAKYQPKATFFLSPSINPDRGAKDYESQIYNEEWETIVIVGHEPTIGELVCKLCGSCPLKISKGCIIELCKQEGEWVIIGLRNF